MPGSIHSHYFHIIRDKLINPIVGVYIPIIRIPTKGGIIPIPNIATTLTMEQIVSPVAEVTRCGEHSTSQLSHSSSCHFRCAGEAKSAKSAVFKGRLDGCTNSSIGFHTVSVWAGCLKMGE